MISTLSETLNLQLHTAPAVESEPWYAIRTKSRHEQVVANQLRMDGVDFYLPVTQESRQWSDRKKVISAPLFPGYVFARVPEFPSKKVQILQKPGVLGFVSNGRGAATIPDTELNGIRLLVSNRVPYASHPYLNVGQQIRIINGALRGLEGILVSLGNKNGLVVSVGTIQRSLIIQLQGYEVQAI
jgi:transcription antitermination factor NusG